MKHTPGPWVYIPAKTIHHAHGMTTHLGAEVCDVATDHEICRAPLVANNWPADCQLIAAAPELLAACKEALATAGCVSRVNQQAPVDRCDCYVCEVARQLQSAISKAEGTK